MYELWVFSQILIRKLSTKMGIETYNLKWASRPFNNRSVTK
jgi:hypothetical protein